MPSQPLESPAEQTPEDAARQSGQRAALTAWLQQAWLRRGLAAWMLLPIAGIFGLLAACHRAAYRWGWRSTYRAGVPVIVVGNVVAGGAGKTPVVLALANHLRGRNVQAGMISRGYGRRNTGTLEVRLDSAPRDVGDEPALIHRLTRLPVFVAETRAAAAQALLAAYPGTRVIVSDDGLQHLALERDIEICVFDDRGIGNGWLLPAGPLRERWPRSCDLVLHSGARPAFAGYRSQRALASHALRSDGSKVLLDSLIGKPLTALAGIANPQAFFDMLRARGLSLSRTLTLPDHCDFNDWRSSGTAGEHLICTEKDAIKLWAHAPDALAVPLLFEPEPAFFAIFDRLLDAKLSSADGHETA